MTSTYFVEKLDVSGGDVVFSNVTNDLTLGITAQATGTATLNIPDLGGNNRDIAPFVTGGGAAADKVVRMTDGVSTIESATNVTLSDGDVFAGVVGVTALASNDLTITSAANQDIVLAVSLREFSGQGYARKNMAAAASAGYNNLQHKLIFLLNLPGLSFAILSNFSSASKSLGFA